MRLNVDISSSSLQTNLEKDYIIAANEIFHSYRIEQALSNDISRKIGPKNVIRVQEIIYAVDIHRKAMKSVFQILSFGGDKDELFLHFSYVSFNLSYMFLANYAAQEVTDHNNHVFVTTYNVQWYAAPLRIQRMILFLLQRGAKTFSLNIGGLIIGSLESFASVRYLMEELQRICNELKDENEIAIMKKYGNIAKFFTAALMCKSIIIRYFKRTEKQRSMQLSHRTSTIEWHSLENRSKERNKDS
ncbi:PREDICTED: uncharacterized protein LOC106746664 [Dinoponera quadriceps]|uniref:Uncharacterized protein LOC106746664 n=1 Tax=Dinoponera quadriceps TaxID=609295 RepID=A0A6P3XKL3_DINQU|nr:PREDICTED: uncharacterized protein LOC106746664 [Dinoponera quadriceps]